MSSKSVDPEQFRGTLTLSFKQRENAIPKEDTKPGCLPKPDRNRRKKAEKSQKEDESLMNELERKDTCRTYHLDLVVHKDDEA